MASANHPCGRKGLRIGMIGCEDLPKWNGKESNKLTARAFEDAGLGCSQRRTADEETGSEHSSPLIEWNYFDATSEDLPKHENLNDYDGFVLTGSHYSVNDKLKWISKLEDWVREIKAFQENNQSAPRVLAVCFSHQLACKAFGGVVGENPHGKFVWNRERIRLVQGAKDHPFFKHEHGCIHDLSYSLYESHGDCILELPAGGKCLGVSKTCDYEIVSFGDDFITMQSHPEFSEIEMVDKILPALKKANLLSEMEAGKEMEAFKSKTDGEFIMNLIEKFFLKI